MVFRVIDNSKNQLKINKKRKNFDIKHCEVKSKLARESSPATPGTSRNLNSFSRQKAPRETVATRLEASLLRNKIIKTSMPSCQMPSRQSVAQSLEQFAKVKRLCEEKHNRKKEATSKDLDLEILEVQADSPEAHEAGWL